jgi:hypothetical protein
MDNSILLAIIAAVMWSMCILSAHAGHDHR